MHLLDHVSIAGPDLERARTFYDASMGALGCEKVYDRLDALSYGARCRADDSFPKRLRNDARCALGIVDFDFARGMLLHVGVRGVATVLALDRGRMLRLLRRYLGDDEATWSPWFRARVIDGLELMIRIDPTSFVARDQSYFSQVPAQFPLRWRR